MIDRLRDEIVESQKARADLLKWKLILAAAIGGAALSIGSNAPRGGPSSILLALIPFVCLYVDAVCYHNEIRIMAIACFVRTRGMEPAWKEYEKYCKQNRGVFALENFALWLTTVFLSLLVFAIGWFKEFRTLIGVGNDFARTGGALAGSGIVGMLAGALFYSIYVLKARQFDNCEC